MSPYSTIHINDLEIDVAKPDDIPYSISVSFEDAEDFQRKKGADSFSVEIPATLINSRSTNGYHELSVRDMTAGAVFKKSGSCMIEYNGVPLLTGKAMLTSAKHTHRPVSYTYDFFGDNKDWGIELKDVTFYDLLQHLNFAMTKSNIVNSWTFDGTDENVPYVFAPVRYREAMGENDDDMKPLYMRPSLSKYWLIYWAFKSIGYRISSDFFDTPYFRRQVMPWTWGSFLYSEGTRMDNLDFLAKSVTAIALYNTDYNDFWDLDVSNDSTNGAFDNNNTYDYIPASKEMRWTYPTGFAYGNLDATFSFQMDIDATVSGGGGITQCKVIVKLYWYKNGVLQGTPVTLCDIRHAGVGRKDFRGIVDAFATFNVSPGDTISAKIHLEQFDSDIGRANVTGNVLAFEFEYFKIPLGGTIDFRNYTGLKKVKFLDLLRGVTDDFNLLFKTDPISKVVYIEPAHGYSLTNDLSDRSGGYILDNVVDWTEKQDLNKVSEVDLYAEGERELIFRHREDPGDGGLKILSDRYSARPSSAKYVLPDRYQSGVKEIDNRFFSAVVHYDVNQWKAITGTPPQMIVLMPENISNTSAREAESTLQPKSAYYKGFDYTSGFKFDGEELDYFPFMFAVNYKPGGENDPVLSYCDERIGTESSGYTIAKGLMKRFYWQRLAIMRNGQYYKSHFLLDIGDVTSLHRDYKVINGDRFERPSIKSFKPMSGESTAVDLWKWEPVTEEDQANSFPSATMILSGSNAAVAEDQRYVTLKILTSDIPK